MPENTNNNGPASDTTPRKPPEDLSEAEFLDREAEDARNAISGTLARMRESLKDAADVKSWTRSYPWATLGAAAAAGFVAAVSLVPKKRAPSEERDPALLERILTDEKIAQRLRELAGEDDKDDKKESTQAPIHTFVSVLLKTFGPAVQSAVVSALSAKAVQDSEQEPPTGQAHDEQPPVEPGDVPPQ